MTLTAWSQFQQILVLVSLAASSSGFTVVLSVGATEPNVPSEVTVTLELSTSARVTGRLACEVKADELLDAIKQIVCTDVVWT